MHAIASQPLGSAQPNTCRTPKHTVKMISERTYRVETVHGSGSQILEDLTVSFATEDCARLVHRVVADSLRDNLNVDQTRAAVAYRLQYEIANEVRRTRPDAAYIADLDRALNIFLPPSTVEHLDRMADELRESMAGVL